MAADKIIRNSKLDTFLSKLATKLTAIFWRKAETTQVSIDDTPTANSNNLVKSGGVKSYVDGAIPTVPTSLSQLSDDSTHRLVTDTEKSTWNGKQNALTFDNTPTANSTNPVTSGGVKAYVDGAIPTVPVTDVTVGGTSVLSNGTAVVPAIPDEVEANPTVPSGTTPTTLQNVKVGNNYYSVPQGSSTTLSTDVTTDKADNTKASTPKSVYDFVGNPIVSMTVPTPNDGTVIFNHRNGDTTILDLNHTHPQYLKYQLCTDEAEYQAIQNKESDKLYGIPEA